MSMLKSYSRGKSNGLRGLKDVIDSEQIEHSMFLSEFNHPSSILDKNMLRKDRRTISSGRAVVAEHEANALESEEYQSHERCGRIKYPVETCVKSLAERVFELKNLTSKMVQDLKAGSRCSTAQSTASKNRINLGCSPIQLYCSHGKKIGCIFFKDERFYYQNLTDECRTKNEDCDTCPALQVQCMRRKRVRNYCRKNFHFRRKLIRTSNANSLECRNRVNRLRKILWRHKVNSRLNALEKHLEELLKSLKSLELKR